MDKLCNIQTMEYYYSMLKKKKKKKKKNKPEIRTYSIKEYQIKGKLYAYSSSVWVNFRLSTKIIAIN